MEKIRLLSPSSCVPKTTKPSLRLPYKKQNQQPNFTTFRFITISTNTSLFRHNFHLNCRRWDSNAENFRTRNFNSNSNSNSNSTSQDTVDDDDDEGQESSEDWSDILEEFIGNAWIFKVFRSYGWMLPAIIASLVLTTGLKAFLLTLAIPLGQSAVSLAFQKVRGRTQSKPNRKRNTRKKTSPKYVNFNEEKRERGRSKQGNVGNQPWAAGSGDNGNKTREESQSFGGWEELDTGSRNTRFEKGFDQTAEMKRRILRSKMSRREGRNDAPLLLRLLIAVFPFLSSWTRML